MCIVDDRKPLFNYRYPAVSPEWDNNLPERAPPKQSGITSACVSIPNRRKPVAYITSGE